MRRACGILLVMVLCVQAAPATIIGAFCEGPQAIIGTGSTTQAPVHAALFIPKYFQACGAAQGKVTYQGAGDEAAMLAALTRDARFQFYASDVPLTAAEKAMIENDTAAIRGRNSLINHIPILIDGFAVAYNLGSCSPPGTLKLRNEILSLIYLGVITRWNDALIVRDNAGLSNCTLPIKVAVRSDAAGPTVVFKDYLSKKNPAWIAFKTQQLRNQWPATLPIACRGIGEAGMASCVGDPGAISYVEYVVAASRGLRVAALENASGAFVAPAAHAGDLWPSNCPPAASAATVPPDTLSDWSNASLTYPAAGYAICSFTYELAFQRMVTAYFNTVAFGQVRNLVDYLNTILGSSVQGSLTSFGYAPLPASVLAISRAGVANIEFT